MCGIAGIVDLRRLRPVPSHALLRMARSLRHRGPDEEGFFLEQGIGLACRRLSIVGLVDGQQPVYNETGSVVAVFNGELFDYPELRSSLQRRGHVLRGHSDSELVVHLWEEFGDEFFTHLRGQFAFALIDLPGQRLILGRDRVGICPLHWSRQGDWLVFASEIKALLASGLVPAVPDARGLDNVFTFFCMPGRRTAFAGVNAVPPGHFVRAELGVVTPAPVVQEHTYWDLDFPDRGDEDRALDTRGLVDAFDEALGNAVRRRLRADVEVGAYLSGGVDSVLMLAKCREITQSPMSTFTARIDDPRLDESARAEHAAAQLGCHQRTVDCGAGALVDLYPCVVTAADCPVVDPTAGSLHALSGAVHQAGLKAVLSGEGADEALAGYVWFKAHRVMTGLGWPGARPAVWGAEKLYYRAFRNAPRGEFRRINAVLGGLHAQTLVYHLTSRPRWWFLRDEWRAETDGETAYDQLEFDGSRVGRWHPLNQSLYMGYKTQLPGLLLNHRGDRAAMANSVETRYPFLDESVIDLCCRIDPRWKLRGLTGDKHLLRLTARQLLPKELAMRPKRMFLAPFANTLLTGTIPYVEQLLSAESLRRTPYFSPERVDEVFSRVRRGACAPPLRLFYEMALCAVVGTQLWHHLFVGGGLCELPSWTAPVVDSRTVLHGSPPSGLQRRSI